MGDDIFHALNLTVKYGTGEAVRFPLRQQMDGVSSGRELDDRRLSMVRAHERVKHLMVSCALAHVHADVLRLA